MLKLSMKKRLWEIVQDLNFVLLLSFVSIIEKKMTVER